MKLSTQLLIDGQFVTGDGQAEPILNPATGELIASVPEASFEQVNRAVNGAQRAFAQWSRTTPASRSTLLLRLADAIERHAEEFAALESLNCGKPYLAVLNDELPAVVDCFRFFAGAARCLQGPLAGEYIEGHTSMIRRDPIGVVGSIAPWNYPLMMAAWKMAPVLAAGNTVVLKPSEQTPLTALRLAEAGQVVAAAAALGHGQLDLEGVDPGVGDVHRRLAEVAGLVAEVALGAYREGAQRHRLEAALPGGRGVGGAARPGAVAARCQVGERRAAGQASEQPGEGEAAQGWHQASCSAGARVCQSVACWNWWAAFSRRASPK